MTSFIRNDGPTAPPPQPPSTTPVEQQRTATAPAPAPAPAPVQAPTDGMESAPPATHAPAAPPTSPAPPPPPASQGAAAARAAGTGAPRGPAADDLTPRFEKAFGRHAAHYREVYDKASPEDRAALLRCMDGPNRWNAFATYEKLKGLQGQLATQGKTLPDDVVRSLTLGVGVPRTAAQNGREGLMGPSQAMQAARAYASLKPEDKARFDDLMAKAGQDQAGTPALGADANAERALLLKALAARRNEVASPDAATRKRALDTVETFAKDIRGSERGQLIRQTTLLDVDEKRNESTFDPRELEKQQKGAPRWHDAAKDNDGIFQKYTMGCVPTSTMVIKGERDPVFALRVHKDLISSATPHSTSGAYEKRVLDRDAGWSQARLAVYNYNRAEKTLDAMAGDAKLGAADKPTVAERAAVLAYLENAGGAAARDKPPAGSDAAKGLEKLRRYAGRFPTDGQVADMRSNHVTDASPPGLDYDQVTDVLNAESATTGVTYERTGATAADYDRAERNLKQGVDVLFVVEWKGGDGGHAMALVDVKGSAPDRQFLVHDPWTGATKWCQESKMKDGTFTRAFGHHDCDVTAFYPVKGI